jgi:hypothetical protein
MIRPAQKQACIIQVTKNNENPDRCSFSLRQKSLAQHKFELLILSAQLLQYYFFFN